MDDDTDEANKEHKSKSQLKREMHALQALGEELVILPTDQLEKISLPEEVLDAVMEARRIHQHGARKRQLQYIGRLMRNLDPAPIQAQLDTIKGQSRQAAQELHHIERWRDRLIKEGDQALELLIQEYPEADRQLLRQLRRNAIKETKANKTPKSARMLFQTLRDLIYGQ